MATTIATRRIKRPPTQARKSAGLIVPRPRRFVADTPSRARRQDAQALGTKHRIGTQYRHGGYLDIDSDVQHLIEARRGLALGDDAHGKRFAVYAMPQHSVNLCTPAGIGDISWVYSKIRHLAQLTGREIRIFVPNEEPHRAGEFVKLLPDVQWGGYMEGMTSWRCITQSLPNEWPAYVGISPILTAMTDLMPFCCVSANHHVEMGKPIREWLPLLATDYHYQLSINLADRAAAERLVARLSRPIVVVYTSNRDKDKYPGWNMWDTADWNWLIGSVSRLKELRRGSFVFIGAGYDRDRTASCARAARETGCRVATMIGRPLGEVFSVMRRASYMFSFPSGMGIMANVLWLPCCMLLPWHLSGLERSFADPVDIASNRYRGWTNPRPSEVFDWFRRVPLPYLCNTDPERWSSS